MKIFSLPATFATLMILLSGGALHGADVRQVQDKLKAQDFYFGEPSGVMDEDTATALRRYQIRNDLAVTGELDEATAKSLGVSATAPAAANTASADRKFLENKVVGVEQPQTTPPPAIPSTPTVSLAERKQLLVSEFLALTSYAAADPASQAEVVRWSQSKLKESGYYQSRIDGVPGDGTRRAVAAYQADHGLRTTGLMDELTLEFLETRIVSRPGPRNFEINVQMAPPIRGQQIFRGLRVR